MKTTKADPIVRGAETWRFRSELADTEYEISVARPSGADEPEATVYVLDANPWFAMVAQLAGSSQRFRELPPLLVVGIGYPLGPMRDPEVYEQWLHRRTHDFFEVTGDDVPAGVRRFDAGGAPQFLRCIEEEIIPFVEAQYPTGPGSRILWGDSGGGHFALYAFLSSPGMFPRCVAGSPGRWTKSLESLAEEWAAKPRDASTLFLGVGSLEEDWQINGVKDAAEGLTTLGGDRLRLHARVFEGETHISVVPLNAGHGLRAVISGANA